MLFEKGDSALQGLRTLTDSGECRSRSFHTQILPGKSNKSRFGDTAQRLPELAAKPENLSSISRMVEEQN